jgi:hypothetical protein
MKKETLKKIFEFIKENENHNVPFLWKFKNNIPITKEDLDVKGDLYLSENQKLNSLPKGLKVRGDLNLSFCESISSLPEGLEVGGDLTIDDSSITSLPKGLKVGGDLYSSFTSIKVLPEDLSVNGGITLTFSHIESLPEGFTVNGYLSVNKCKKLKSLPKGLKITHHMDLQGTPIEFLPKGLEVGHNFTISDTPLTKYTDDEIREMIAPGFINGIIIRD